MNLRQIVNNTLTEEIYGNIATVYHRFPSSDRKKIRSFFDGTYENVNHIDFDRHSKGLYTTFNMDSQLSKKGYTNMEETYGDRIVKIAIKNLHNYMFLDFDQYKQKINPKASKNTYIKEQLKKFGIEKYFPEMNENSHVTFSRIVERKKLFDKVAGIVYHGSHDGDCILIYNNKNIMPLGVSADNGNTWIKYSDFKKEDFADKFKETYNSRKKEYFKSNPLEVEKDKLFVKKQVPQDFVKKVSEQDNNYFKPTDKIFYTIKREKENKLADYTFYNNGKKIITLNRYTSKWDIIDNDKGRFCYYLMKYLTHNSSAKIEETIKNTRNAFNNNLKKIIENTNNNFKSNVKLISPTSYTNNIIPKFFKFEKGKDIFLAEFSNNELSGLPDLPSPLTQTEKIEMINKIKYFLAEFKKINRKEIIEKKKTNMTEIKRRKELFNY